MLAKILKYGKNYEIKDGHLYIEYNYEIRDGYAVILELICQTLKQGVFYQRVNYLNSVAEFTGNHAVREPARHNAY